VILLHRMKRHFEARAIEWGMSGWALTWGIQALINPEVFNDPVLFPLNADMLHTLELLMPHSTAATFIATLAICVGSARAIALWINGAWCQTPMIRVITSALSAFVVSNIVFSLMQGPPSLALVTYSWLFAADCFSGFRAAKDYKILHDEVTYARG
jgi:hypothetical protein